jgi:hypothetical protein
MRMNPPGFAGLHHSDESKKYISLANTKWTTHEVYILWREYQKEIVDLIKLSKTLHRLPSNICRKARMLGLETLQSRPKGQKQKDKMSRDRGTLNKKQREFIAVNYNNYTKNELANLFDVSRKAISNFADRNNLKTDYEKRGWRWRSGHPRGMAGKNHSDELKKKISEQSRARWADPENPLHSDEHRQARSDRAHAFQVSGKWRNGYSRARVGKRIDLNNQYFRSSWEANYARYLNWLIAQGKIKEWFYEKDRFDFPIQRGTRSYLPDFKVVENNGEVVYHEVKGWMTQRGQTAINRMAKYYPQIKLILIAKKEYMAISKWKSLIGNWE